MRPIELIATLSLLLLLGFEAAAAPATRSPRDSLVIADATSNIDRGASYLNASGALADSNAVIDYLIGIDFALTASPATRPLHMQSMAQWLVATGNTRGRLESLQARGHDVARAIKAGINGSVYDYALLSEAALVGTLVKVENQNGDDFYRSTLTFSVDEVLRGKPKGRTIKLRQRSGNDGDGHYVQHTSDIDGEVGQKYLLFVSHGLYDLAVAQEAGSSVGPDAHYIAQRAPFEISKDDTLSPVGIGVPAPNRKLSDMRPKLRVIN